MTQLWQVALQLKWLTACTQPQLTAVPRMQSTTFANELIRWTLKGNRATFPPDIRVRDTTWAGGGLSDPETSTWVSWWVPSGHPRNEVIAIWHSYDLPMILRNCLTLRWAHTFSTNAERPTEWFVNDQTRPTEGHLPFNYSIQWIWFAKYSHPDDAGFGSLLQSIRCHVRIPSPKQQLEFHWLSQLPLPRSKPHQPIRLLHSITVPPYPVASRISIRTRHLDPAEQFRSL